MGVTSPRDICAHLLNPGAVYSGSPKRTHSIWDLIQRRNHCYLLSQFGAAFSAKLYWGCVVRTAVRTNNSCHRFCCWWMSNGLFRCLCTKNLIAALVYRIIFCFELRNFLLFLFNHRKLLTQGRKIKVSGFPKRICSFAHSGNQPLNFRIDWLDMCLNFHLFQRRWSLDTNRSYSAIKRSLKLLEGWSWWSILREKISPFSISNVTETSARTWNRLNLTILIIRIVVRFVKLINIIYHCSQHKYIGTELPVKIALRLCSQCRHSCRQ